VNTAIDLSNVVGRTESVGVAVEELVALLAERGGLIQGLF
jgi:hypothetical protein